MSFTWYDNYSSMVAMMPPEHQSAFILAIVKYASDGSEPDLEYPLNAIFEGIKPNLESSIAAHSNGGKGGRPKKVRNPAANDEKPQSKPDEKGVRNPVSETPETPPFKPKGV